MPFSFENLDVYQKSLSLVQQLDSLNRSLSGKVSRSFHDQLSRAALSIPLNIAEGNGRWHKKEKQQFFWIARGSVFEVVAILQVVKKSGVLAANEYGGHYGNLESISRMLTNLIKSVDNLNQEKLHGVEGSK